MMLKLLGSTNSLLSFMCWSGVLSYYYCLLGYFILIFLVNINGLVKFNNLRTKVANRSLLNKPDLVSKKASY